MVDAGQPGRRADRSECETSVPSSFSDVVCQVSQPLSCADT